MATRKDSAKGAASASSLGRYRELRDPVATNEPFGPERTTSRRPTLTGRFVVHEHHATRSHFDLRLEMGGVLASFAVPKGPSLDPREKRLAIRTEDHPLAYLDFEDVIPAGNYGAGPMIVWDAGRVDYLEGSAEDGVLRGKIDFALSGFKLRGRFGLIHTARRPGEENHWLLVKKEDAHASEQAIDDQRSVLGGLLVTELAERERIARELRERALALGARPRASHKPPEPMLCASGGARLDDPERLYELKLDGVRILAERRGGVVTLRYRGGGAAQASYPEIARALAAFPADHFLVDGEIVAFDEAGRPSFRRLLPRVTARRPREAERVRHEVPVVYLVFDLLALADLDLTGLPLVERKGLLFSLCRGRGLVRALDHIEGSGAELFAMCEAHQLEGVVAKTKHSPYVASARRTDAWVKLKRERDDEFVVVGWEPEKGKTRALGALWLATFSQERLVLRGKVGSGLDRAARAALEERFMELALDSPAPELELPAAPPPRGVRWVRPELVVSVRFAEWTEDGVLRHPVFRGLRVDVSPHDCVAAPAPGDHVATAAAPVTVASGRVVISNREKLFWPEDGLTKGDLVDYYRTIAPVLLPFLRDRPVVLVRYPDGIEGKSFYQWRAPQGTPDWMRTLELRDEEDEVRRGTKSVFLIDDEDGLAFVANLGAIPIHVLASHAADLGCGDFFTIDLDVELASLRDGVTLALSLRSLLQESGLVGYPKTSGKEGLHVLVPVGPHVPFAVTRALAELFGRLLAHLHPDIATMERKVGSRGARVYVDTGQTGRSRTIVAPYSVREVAGARVSTPLSWEEVHAALDPANHTMLTVPERIAELGDPMASFAHQRPDIPRALARLEARFKSGLEGG